MQQAWGNPGQRNLEEIEIIDILGEDELAERWKNFIHSHHYRTTDAVGKSWIARHPRRTCEVMWNMLMEGRWPEDNWLPADLGFNELYSWVGPLIEAETAAPNT